MPSREPGLVLLVVSFIVVGISGGNEVRVAVIRGKVDVNELVLARFVIELGGRAQFHDVRRTKLRN